MEKQFCSEMESVRERLNQQLADNVGRIPNEETIALSQEMDELLNNWLEKNS